MSSTRPLRSIVLLVLAPSIACGGAAANQNLGTQAPTSAADPCAPRDTASGRESSSSRPATPTAARLRILHDEIQMLDAEIREWRRELKLDTSSPCGRDVPFVPCLGRNEENDGIAADETADVCRDTCTLTERICENADEICQGAHDAGDNAWARDKCVAARGSCRAATHRCCTCSRGGAAGSPPLIL